MCSRTQTGAIACGTVESTSSHAGAVHSGRTAPHGTNSAGVVLEELQPMRRLMLDQFVKDCTLWKGPHNQTREMRAEANHYELCVTSITYASQGKKEVEEL